MFTIKECKSDEDFGRAAELAAELAEWDIAETKKLGISAHDVAEFYYPEDTPLRLMLIASAGAAPAACIGYRELSPGICELKRFYVRPMFRGAGLGALMISSLAEKAAEFGYTLMCLETTVFMKGATRLYRQADFIQCEPYYPIPDMFREISIFMKKSLGAN